MAISETKHILKFASNALSNEVIIDVRDMIVALSTTSAFVGVTLAAEFSFDNGTTWVPVADQAGTQVCKIVDGSLASGAGYSLADDEWDVTSRLKLRSSSASEVGPVTLITKRRG